MPVPVSRDSYPNTAFADVGPEDVIYGNAGPWSPMREYYVGRALSVARITSQEIRDGVKPQVPQILFPPRFGYSHTPLSVEEVLSTDRWTPRRRSWVSGGATPPTRQLSGTEWSSSMRNVL